MKFLRLPLNNHAPDTSKEYFMKPILKLFGIIAFIAVSGNAYGQLLTIPGLRSQSGTVTNNAIIQEFNGRFTETGQKADYKFTPPVSGRYRFEMLGLVSANVSMEIRNSTSSVVKSGYGIGNGNGLTIDDIKGGETYTIQIGQNSGLSLYRLSIGYQKPTEDITGYTEINDSIEFKDQRNNYKWTAPATVGRYRFEISNLASANIYMAVINSFGMVVKSGYGISNGNGLTIDDEIRSGETYTIQIGQNSGLSLYRLSIGYQKPTVNISDFSEIIDSIQFTAQYNNYSWTAPTTGGRYRFEITNLASANIYMAVINSFGMELKSYYGIGNGGGLTNVEIRGGETYTIRIGQSSGLSQYRLSIRRE
jgi:hypothetical protein